MQIKKANIIIIGTVLSSAVLFTACKSSKPTVITQTETVKVTEKLHDTIFEIKADSSFYKALLECRDGKVVTKEILVSKPSPSLNVPKVKIENNKLEVDCYAEAQKLFAQWKSKEVTKTEIKQVPVYIEYEPTWWETFLMQFGKFCLIVVCIAFIVWITKKQLSAYKP